MMLDVDSRNFTHLFLLLLLLFLTQYSVSISTVSGFKALLSEPEKTANPNTSQKHTEKEFLSFF